MMRNFKMMVSAAAIAALVPSLAVADPGGNGKGGGGSKAAASHGNGGGNDKSAAPHGNSGHGAKPVKATGSARMNGGGSGATKATTVSTNGKSASRRVVNDVRADNFFDRNDEAAIRSYYGNSASCPPGLRAKNNGCLPPGQAKKSYNVGTILPTDLRLTPLPSDLLGRLPIAPDGYYYGRYNGDVYLVENSTRRIIDNILLSLLR